MESVKKAVDKVIHPGHHETTSSTTGTAHHSTNAGPHSSNVANKLDPRVDSDRDGSHPGQGAAGAALGGSHAHGGALDPHTRTTAGPHGSDTANKADPRVDSDRSGHHAGQGTIGSTFGGAHDNRTGNTVDPSQRTTAGPHNSDILNKLDPRIDSDRDGKGALQPGTNRGYGGTTHTGIGGGSTNAGPHSSNVANKADPRVDSDLDNRGTGHHGVTGTTGSNTTAGPHGSNILNKLDPRVDSDLDGSRRVGSTSDEFDAAKHSPTTARNLLGETEILHEHDPKDHQRRHSLAKGDARNAQY